MADLAKIWSLLRGASSLLEHLEMIGPRHVLPSPFDVTGLASDCVSAAHLAVAELHSVRRSETPLPQVTIDTLEACAAFRSEALLEPLGWTLPPPWDPIAGDYRAADRWIRLHTNYVYHRKAVTDVLEINADKEVVTKKVALMSAIDLEERVVAHGGCAAIMWSEEEWRHHPIGKNATQESPVSLIHGETSQTPRFEISKNAALPLSGIRVLDLTRVIAGPGCTRLLAAYGADVLRIDPLGFEEVPAVLPDTTIGKRRAFLDLKTPDGQSAFTRLVSEAHVLVVGLHAGSLARIGFSDERLRELNPGLIITELNAYGWSNEWRERRGFDSLVQMSSGIAATGARVAGSEKPTPLPCQALDHGAGYLLAAGVCRALTDFIKTNRAPRVRVSLIGMSNALKERGPGDTQIPMPAPRTFSPYLIETITDWGPIRRVRSPGQIAGLSPTWTIPAGPLGTHAPSF